MCNGKVLALFIIVMTLLGCRVPDDHLIIVGKRVGKLTIGHTNASEVGLNGSISEKYNNQGLGIGFNHDEKIDSVSVFRPNYGTREGLKVGSSEEDVIAEYGKPERVDVPIMAGNSQKGMLSNNVLHYKGIRWVIGSDRRVTMIIVSSE